MKDSTDGPKTTQQGLKLFAAKQRPPGLAPSRLPSLQRSTFRGVGSRGMNHHLRRGKKYYRAVALEFEERHVFEPAARGKPAKLDAAIMITSELCVWSGCWWVLGAEHPALAGCWVLSTQPWLGAGLV